MTEPTIEALRRAREHAERFLEGLDDRPVAARASVAELREQLDVGLSDEGVDPVRVIDELAAAVDGGLLGSTGGRFFAWVIGGNLPSSLAADWLTSTWDQNAAMNSTSPAVGVVEEVVGAWLLELLDLPRESSFALTTGCQMAHFTALSVARAQVLRDAGWDVNEDGLCGAPPIRVLTSEHRHASVDRAVRLLGLGNKSMIALETDGDGRIRPAALEHALDEGASPTVVVLDAADLNIAAFDDFTTLIPLAKAKGAWVHVDGAFGLFARASRTKRHLLDGVEAADSWATDGHKWLNVPFDCGVAMVKDAEAHRNAMTVTASYIAANKGARDEIDWNPEWSRRARAIPVYAALRELGKRGLEELIDRTCAHAEAIVDGVGALDGAEVVWRPRLNQGLVRFLDPTPSATTEAHDARTDAVIAAINDSGEAFFSGTTWEGRRAMRVSVVNWRTTSVDVERVVAAVRRALDS